MAGEKQGGSTGVIQGIFNRFWGSAGADQREQARRDQAEKAIAAFVAKRVNDKKQINEAKKILANKKAEKDKTHAEQLVSDRRVEEKRRRGGRI
ncbi:hypothetical protein phytr_3460 [Candidatus Phycorickettsia trachydisci]|uniref:Uncharacterized protein n=1 Tax=Candidatus Phycorickettsia trachydisci TaxID=2115978 RepID=A0A2P1P7Q4_9RICK|nr:hypothetical protein [Candidatus Phycorickettsia trachydisci]AVP87299.1 hypothetical protein phytr_3460 [Candidatus Phycorickettsia trachydisci]